MIAQEVEKRTQIRLERNQFADAPAIKIGRGSGAADGFSVSTAANAVEIRGNDDRGVIFGAGYFLRRLDMAKQRVTIAEGLHVTTTPKIAIRGHQLGYRPKTNAYDG